MDNLHVGEITVTRVLGMTGPVQLVYHRQDKPIGYLLPITPEITQYVESLEQGREPCSEQSTSDMEP